MKDAVDLAKKAAGSNATVLLLGESGTGKKSSLGPFTTGVREKTDLSSLSIRWGSRKNSWRASFSATNKARLPARTGARRARSNWPWRHDLFDQTRRCLSGTSSQALAVSSRTRVRARGRSYGRFPLCKDYSATNRRDLSVPLKKDGSVQDLYYRLNVVAIHLPPLRERREDIAALAQDFLRKHSATIRGKFTDDSPKEAWRKT